MICFSCGHCSQAVACPYCGRRTEPNGNTRVGFSISDLPNPFSYAYNLGKDLGSGNTVLPTPGNAYELGKELGGIATDIYKGGVQTTDSIDSLLSVGKWVLIGGAVFFAVIVGYGVLKFIPVALATAATNIGNVNKMVPDIAAKALR